MCNKYKSTLKPNCMRMVCLGPWMWGCLSLKMHSWTRVDGIRKTCNEFLGTPHKSQIPSWWIMLSVMVNGHGQWWSTMAPRFWATSAINLLVNNQLVGGKLPNNLLTSNNGTGWWLVTWSMIVGKLMASDLGYLPNQCPSSWYLLAKC